ncbi:hypothetical protein PAMP_014673 [Pampus punctatissimus]
MSFNAQPTVSMETSLAAAMQGVDHPVSVRFCPVSSRRYRTWTFPPQMLSSRMTGNQLEDLQELAFSERPIRRSLKTTEEIDQLTVDEDLNDIERAVYLLRSGYVRTTITFIVCAALYGRCVIQEVLNGAGAEIQLAAAASFLTILQDDIILIHTHTYSILKTVLLHLNHRDTVVSNAWLETLLSAINTLPKETIKQEVLNPLLYQPQLSHSLQARLASCRILGKVACKFDSHIVKKELLPLVRSLCQDVEFEVRVSMCRQLENIARATGEDDTRTELLPELVDLARDEESGVRLAAFDTIINLMEVIDSDDRLHVVVPLVMSVCEASSQVDKAVAASLSFQFGKLCSGLAEDMGPVYPCFVDVEVYGYQVYVSTRLSLVMDSMRRLKDIKLTAMSRPRSVVTAATTCRLCCDPEVSVRRSAAASFHQVVKLLGSKAQLVHKELLALLQDDALEVLDALMNHLEETLEAVLSRGENLMLDNKFTELLSALLLAEEKVGCSLRWRLHEKLLQHYSCLARLLPGELLHQSFSPRIFGILTTNVSTAQRDTIRHDHVNPVNRQVTLWLMCLQKVLPVQREAARTLCMFLRYNRKQEQRQDMMERLIQDLAQGRSYWNRLRFLDVCEMATEIFSRKYFNKHFLIPALELVHDPVANVRYKLCQLLPRLRSLLRLPSDKQLLQQLDFCVQKLLCREKDKDVVATIRQTVLELDKLDLTEPFNKWQERDLLDQKKEKEETLLLEMEQLERQQSDGKLNSEKHTDRKRRDSKISLSATNSISVSSSGAAGSSGKEMRRAKLSRSRSLSSQPTNSQIANLDRSLKVKELGGCSGPGTSSMLPSKDESLRTAHFTMATLSQTQSTPSMPVLIRSNTTSLLDRTSTLDQRDHRTSTLDQRSKSIDQHGSGVKDSQSRKLSM